MKLSPPNTHQMMPSMQNMMPTFGGPRQMNPMMGPGGMPAPHQQIGQQMPMGPDPFAMIGQGMIPFSDVPIKEQQGLSEFLISTDDYPDDFKKHFWYTLTRDTPLTFLNDDRKNTAMIMFDIAKIDILNSLPFYDYTMKIEGEFNLARNIYETRANRAVGTNNADMKNERTVQQSQFMESRQYLNDGGFNSDGQNSLWKRLLGRK